ncbi:2-phosphosulfolactate phosphatase [Psychromicrobium lacuslunae]|uniref:2-phosphosulfolactate phosphatase n=1 Tax=Psychromicrobium lacuslunae TaxID=1618207 RepID=UPI000695E83F|nr:2-phosphosulfolactate phosphatase [Psychromicrobium lacuslunae]
MEIDFAWGLSGALAQCEAGVPAVVHDILSFSTTVCLAVERGIEVLPFADSADSADGADSPGNAKLSASYARERGAELAARRGDGSAGLSLSPQSIVASREKLPARLVLPSPNGATISAALAERGAQVYASCFRNVTATAGYLHRQQPAKVLSIAAGERWPDGSLRPAIEDLLGAAVLIEQLSQLAGTAVQLSDQAAIALAGLSGIPADLGTVIGRSASGLELAGIGYQGDVELACQLDSSTVVARYDPDSASFRATTISANTTPTDMTSATTTKATERVSTTD